MSQLDRELRRTLVGFCPHHPESQILGLIASSKAEIERLDISETSAASALEKLWRTTVHLDALWDSLSSDPRSEGTKTRQALAELFIQHGRRLGLSRADAVMIYIHRSLHGCMLLGTSSFGCVGTMMGRNLKSRRHDPQSMQNMN